MNNRLKEIIEAANLSEEGVLNNSKSKFVINSRNYSFSLSEKGDDGIMLEIVYKNRLTKDIQELNAMKYAKINAIVSIGGFSIDNRGQIKLEKFFSKHEETDNIVYAVIQFLQNADHFVIL